MLKELTIENLTLVEKLHLDMRKGFICVTGETGAGKSALIHSLSLLAGAKADRERIRAGADKLRVEGIFALPTHSFFAEWFKVNEIELESECILSREVTATGTSRARVNGNIIPLTQFQELGSQLVQLHGQSEQIRLKDIRFHLKWLDQYAESDSLLIPYRESYQSLAKIRKKISDLQKEFESKDQQSEFLKFQLKELENARLKVGEEDEIRQHLESLEHSADLVQLKEEALTLLSDGSKDLLSGLTELQKKLSALADIAPQVENWPNVLDDQIASLESLQSDLLSLRTPEEMSLSEIDRLNQRLSQLQKLQRKYKTNMQGLFALYDERQRDVELLDEFQSLLQGLRKEEERALQLIQNQGSQITTHRQKFAQQLDQLINENLQNLGMAGARFRTDLQPLREPSPEGMDRVEFFISPNAGEGEKALKSTLSGGELSRIMLSLKSALAEKDEIPVLVFDEVDSGISGEVAHRIAQTLKELGAFHQVLSITHLHQVASKANHQLKVVKDVIQDRTISKIHWVEAEERVEELARMLGDSRSAQSLEHARTLLKST